MTRSWLAGLALVATSAVIPHAAAATADVIHGGCFYESDQITLLTGPTYVGVIGDLSVTTTGDPTPAPLGASVTCWLEVNGVPAPGTTHTYGDLGAPLEAGSDPIAYDAGPLDQVNLCQSVAFADGATTSECLVEVRDPIPPQEITDVVHALLDDVFAVVDPFVLEPLVCPALSSLSGGYGPVVVAGDGDVYLVDPFSGADDVLIDCPPYKETP